MSAVDFGPLLALRPECDRMRDQILAGDVPTVEEYQAWAEPIRDALEVVDEQIVALTRIYGDRDGVRLADASDCLLDNVVGIDATNIAFDACRGAIRAAS